jgi:NAD(P)H-flavin reductase
MVLEIETLRGYWPVKEPTMPRSFRVYKRHQETADTFTLEFKPLEGNDSCCFAPGQFNMVYIFGVGEVPLSISGNPQESNHWTHTTRIVGTVTQAIGRLDCGDTVGIRGPFGNPWPLHEGLGRDVVVVAGGIGLAPLRPVLHEIVARRNEFQSVVLLYGTRTPSDILFRKQIEDWASQHRIELLMTVDRSTLDWRGQVGVVTHLIPRIPFTPKNAVVFTCGPEVMMRFVINEMIRRGVPAGRMFLSMERNMKCAVGFCGRCQYGPSFICKDGPVFRYDRVRALLNLWEI